MFANTLTSAAVFSRGGLILAVVLLALLGACATVPSPDGASGMSGTTPGTGPSTAPRPKPNVNLSGYPPAFKDGFSDGCESVRGNYRREGRFGKDNDYTLGWQDGYSICGRQKR